MPSIIIIIIIIIIYNSTILRSLIKALFSYCTKNNFIKLNVIATYCMLKLEEHSFQNGSDRLSRGNGFLVSKETVVLRRWERSKQKFGLSNKLIKVELPRVKDLES